MPQRSHGAKFTKPPRPLPSKHTRNTHRSLKSLDGAAKKKDVATANSKLEEALGSLDSWLALEPKA